MAKKRLYIGKDIDYCNNAYHDMPCKKGRYLSRRGVYSCAEDDCPNAIDDPTKIKFRRTLNAIRFEQSLPEREPPFSPPRERE